MRRFPRDFSRRHCRSRQREADRRNPRATKRRKAPRAHARQRRDACAPAIPPAAIAQFNQAMEAIGESVAACIYLGRWGDLESAIREYASVLRIDPTRLLFSAMFNVVARCGLTATDATELAECMHDMRECERLARTARPLAASVELLRLSFDHPAALMTFDRITSASPEEVH